MAITSSIKTCLWFNDNAEDAVLFYVSLIEGSRVVEEMRNGDGGPGKKGSILTMEFELDGQRFVALNGGPHFELTEAVSITVMVDTQVEVDRLWHGLTAEGGQESRCGWLKDRWGLSWQVVPRALPRLLNNPEPAKAARVMQAMMTMKKLDVAALEAAAG